jgi:hypothetical protein
MLVVVVFGNGDRWSRELVLDQSKHNAWGEAMKGLGRQLTRNGWKPQNIAVVTCFIDTHVSIYDTSGDVAEVLGLEG